MALNSFSGHIYIINYQYIQPNALFVQEYIYFCIIHFTWYFLVNEPYYWWFYLYQPVIYTIGLIISIFLVIQVDFFSFKAYILFHKHLHFCLVVVGLMDYTDLVRSFLLSVVVMFAAMFSVGLWLRFSLISLVLLITFLFFVPFFHILFVVLVLICSFYDYCFIDSCWTQCCHNLPHSHHFHLHFHIFLNTFHWYYYLYLDSNWHSTWWKYDMCWSQLVFIFTKYRESQIMI